MFYHHIISTNCFVFIVMRFFISFVPGPQKERFRIVPSRYFLLLLRTEYRHSTVPENAVESPPPWLGNNDYWTELYTVKMDLKSASRRNRSDSFHLLDSTSLANIKKPFTPNDVKYAILKYSLNKSSGYDRIDAKVTRAIVHTTHIFNASFRLSYFPLFWKLSTIILFLKPNKPPDIPSSHRLLPFFAKILERLILKRILPIITKKNILSNTQFDFRVSYLTKVQRVEDAISYALEKKL